MIIEKYYYHGTFYTWHHEPQNLYTRRHISIQSAVIAINCGILSEVQTHSPAEERLKYIGHSDAGIITVITDESSTRIITVWHSSKDEVKEWLRSQ